VVEAFFLFLEVESLKPALYILFTSLINGINTKIYLQTASDRHEQGRPGENGPREPASKDTSEQSIPLKKIISANSPYTSP
jgi:hypothetical protein